MSRETNDESGPTESLTRRSFIGVAAAGAIVTACDPSSMASAGTAAGGEAPTLRWGVVGTGAIANSMAGMIQSAETAVLSAVSSRRMETAREFADRHDVPNAFDSWAEMAASDAVDAIYVATPTSAREEICLAAASNGKHVLGEKPFASVASVRRITDACLEHDVAFMDGTHFPHHPRTAEIRTRREELVGTTTTVASVFQFNLSNRSNIRYNTDLEPMGAIGDAGWYNMRAAVEYLPAGVLEGVSAFLRRDEETGATIAGSGALQFAGGETSTWTCGFDSGVRVADLRIAGTSGVIYIDDFLTQNADGSADFRRRAGRDSEVVSIPSAKPGAVLMFEDMAAAAADPTLRRQWMTATERTQTLLDAVWRAGLENEDRDR